jgi:hypothetical protein
MHSSPAVNDTAHEQLPGSTLGTTAEAGFFAGRHCRVPSDWPSPLLRFMDGPIRRIAPMTGR